MSTITNESITPIASADVLSALKPNSLYILLFWHPNPDIRYHWGLYHHAGSREGGWKFDIINPGGVWKLAFPYEDGKPQLGILDPNPREPLGVAVRVGTVGAQEVRRAHEVIRVEDGRLNELNAELRGGISCRVYVMRACERLKAAGLLEYSGWIDCEKEVLRNGDLEESVKRKGVIVVGSTTVKIRCDD